MADNTSLKRAISLPMLILYGVGTILGLGIYVLLGKVAGQSGMLTPFAFLIAAVIATFTGLSYGELSARLPFSAGEVTFIHRAFNRKSFASIVGWLIILSAMASTAAVINGYVGYVQRYVNAESWILITLFVVILGSIAVWGINQSAIMVAVITVIELAGIIMVIIVAGDNFEHFGSRWHELIPNGSFESIELVSLGAFLSFFAFIGFEDMVNIAEEVKNPEKNMPKAILIALVIMSITYVLVAMIAVFGLSQSELKNSSAPLADILQKKGDIYPLIISLIGLVAIVNGVLVQIIMSSRVLYGMARESMAPRTFSNVNRKTRTPIRATLFIVIPVLFLAILWDLDGLAKVTNYIILTVFILVNVSLWKLKSSSEHPENIKKIPTIIPVLGAVLSLLLIIFQALSDLNSFG